jgi:predicted DNA-binding protein
LNDNDTKYSNNSKSILSNLSPNNTSLNLNESNSNNIPKSFRLDFNDLFEYIKEHQNSSKKTKTFCSDIKLIIEKYINDFNIYLSKNILEKIIKKFSDIYEERFNKYTEIIRRNHLFCKLNMDYYSLKMYINAGE